jgi:hypothetical protein
MRLELDDGEAEAIALASELSAVLLIDEADGRAAAFALGVRVTGVVGILLAAKTSLLVPAVRPLLNQLRADGRFFLSDKFYLHALKLAGEQE